MKLDTFVKVGGFFLAIVGAFITLWQLNFFRTDVLNYTFDEPSCRSDNESNGDQHCWQRFRVFNDGTRTEELIRISIRNLPVDSVDSDRPHSVSKQGEFTIIDYGSLPAHGSFYIDFTYPDVRVIFSSAIRIESKDRIAKHVPRPPEKPIIIYYWDDELMIYEKPSDPPNKLWVGAQMVALTITLAFLCFKVAGTLQTIGKIVARKHALRLSRAEQAQAHENGLVSVFTIRDDEECRPV